MTDQQCQIIFIDGTVFLTKRIRLIRLYLHLILSD